jgi:hypothetical protein
VAVTGIMYIFVNEWTSRYWNEKEQSSSSCHEAHEWSDLEYGTAGIHMTSISTVKSIYKGHSWEYENVAFMSRYPLYTGSNCTCYSLMGKTRLSFIDSDLLYRGAL